MPKMESQVSQVLKVNQGYQDFLDLQALQAPVDSVTHHNAHTLLAWDPDLVVSKDGETNGDS